MYASGFSCLYGFSPVVAPAPADWPAGHVVTGYWFLEEEPGWTPEPALEQFVSTGSPPLYIGFGSMGMHQAPGMLQVVGDALELSGQRAVIPSGSQPRGLPPDRLPRMFFVDQVSHAWLFPRMAAVMHHGGAGTTAEALRAGVPSLVFPGAADQFFWAERIALLGAGPAPIARRDLSPAGLAKLFTRAVTDREMRERARRIGEKIRAEDGVARAVEELTPMIDPGGLRASASGSPAGE